MNIEISDKKYERELNWHDAHLYCSVLSIDNKNDWRLPTLEELREIYNSDNNFVDAGYDSGYWSSTEENDYYAWFARMLNGNRVSGHKLRCNFYVRPVRTI